MTQYLLVGIVHEIPLEGLFGDRLMTTDCSERFEQDAAPLINDRTLVLVEGIMNKTLVGPDHPKYALLHDGLFRLPKTKLPTFGGFDPRSTFTSLEKVKTESLQYDKWDMAVQTLVQYERLRPVPTSLAETIAALRIGPPKAQLTRQPTSEEKAIARKVNVSARKFDRMYLEAMRKYGSRFDTCLFVGGATHVVSMALTFKHEYELINIVGREHVAYTYDAYLAYYHWPRLVFNA